MLATRWTAGPPEGDHNASRIYIRHVLCNCRCRIPVLASRTMKTHETEHHLPSRLKIVHQATCTTYGISLTFWRIVGSAPEFLELNWSSRCSGVADLQDSRPPRPLRWRLLSLEAERKARLERLRIFYRTVACRFVAELTMGNPQRRRRHAHVGTQMELVEAL